MAQKRKRCVGPHKNLMEALGHENLWCGACTFWETDKERKVRLAKESIRKA